MAAAAAACALACALALAGCSIALPGGAPTAQIDEDVTGSIPKKPTGSPLSPRLDSEDWRRARAALATALDPQGNGSSVAWENPQSGRRGSFTPIAAPYPVDGRVCRAFVARLEADEKEHIQGAACRVGGTDDWDLKDVRPFKSS